MSMPWSSIDRHSIFGKLLRLPLHLIPKGAMLSIRRGPAKGYKWQVGSSTHGCWLGTYELEKQTALLQFVRSGMTVYDIGAQAGFYSLFFSNLVSHKGIVYAFEPFPDNVGNLLRHLKVNQIKNLRIYMMALGSKNGFSNFSIDRGSTENRIVEDEKSFLTVPCHSLDHLIGSGELLPPSLIKMDVEGHESEVLKGGEEVLRKYRPIVFLALHGLKQQTFCLPFLRKLDYSLYDISGHVIGEGIMADEVYALPQS